MGSNITNSSRSRAGRATRAQAAVPAHTSADVQAVLDAFRYIVQALRVGSGDGRAARITPAQLFALQQVDTHPDSSINDIAGLTFTHQSSVSVVVQRLVDAGLVKKAAAGDRRRMRVSVTAKGRRTLARAPRSVQRDLVAALLRLSVADRRSLARLLTILASAVRVDGVRRPPMFFEPSGR